MLNFVISLFTVQNEPLLVKVLGDVNKAGIVFRAGPAQFGYDLRTRPSIKGKVVIGEPYKMCSGDIVNRQELKGKIVLVERGNCMFIDKVNRLWRIWYESSLFHHLTSGWHFFVALF